MALLRLSRNQQREFQRNAKALALLFGMDRNTVLGDNCYDKLEQKTVTLPDEMLATISAQEGESRYIPLPKFNRVFLRQQFFAKQNVSQSDLKEYDIDTDYRASDIFEPLPPEENLSHYSRFAHHLCEDLGLEAAYTKFRVDEQIAAGKKWCERNGVQYDETTIMGWKIRGPYLVY